MAEVAVSVVLDRLISFLSAEMKFLGGIKEEVEYIQIELQYISCFLREADSMAETDREDRNSGLKLWVRNVREVAYRIEDVLDDYMLYVAQHHNKSNGIKASFAKIPYLLDIMKKKHKIASEIKLIKASVCGIKERSERYGFNFNNMSQWGKSKSASESDPRMGLHFVEKGELVGIDFSSQELVNRLKDGVLTRSIISVVGMGGVGKSTLAKKVLDDQMVTEHFDCYAWITVSQTYKVEELLRALIKQVYNSRKEATSSGVKTMDGVQLISECRAYLQDKRYFVVFDDVWKEDFWHDMEFALLDNKKGSKILMTTRNMNTVEFCKKSSLVHVHNLKPLPLELGQELLCRIAFKFDEHKQCPKELKDLSFEIVKRCEGLPLAIVAIGGLLATKGKDPFMWKRLLDSLSAELDSSPHLSYIKKILSFSYYDLPYHLKGCLLYLGLFPEDYSISCKRLARMWIAEGFVKGKHGMTSEEVAMEYLNELINRSLVQVSFIDYSGNVRNCRLHDLMREVILSKSEELGFIRTSLENLIGHMGAARYCSINNAATDFPMITGNCQTHSIIFFDIEKLPKSLFISLFTKFKLLKELNFEGAPIDYIPEELGNLLHLKYLCIRDTKVKKLPKSIGKLHNLQILDLKRSCVSELPVEVNMLFSLRYLVAYHKDRESSYNINFRKGIKLYCNFGRMESLERLYEVDMEAYSGSDFFQELKQLKQLRKLCICKVKSESGQQLCSSIQQMHHLQSLRISSIKEEDALKLETICSPPLFLCHLRLRGRLESLPDWISKLTNLTKLTLEWSRIADDSLQILGILPKLLLFATYAVYDGAELHFQRNYFQKLKGLYLWGLGGLKRLIIEEGALAQVKTLEIGPCFQLEELPSSICDLKSLKTLCFFDMPKEFGRKLLPDVGSDHWKVKHIPNIYFKGKQHNTYKLGDPRLQEFLLH